MLNIIIEGVDRSGKSTLSEQLLETFDLHYKHFTADQNTNNQEDVVLIPNVPVFFQYKNYLIDIEKQRMEAYHFNRKGFETDYNFLWDRFIYSDAVYGPIYKNFCRPIDRFEIAFIENLLKSINTCIIHCQLEDEELNWNLISDEGKNLMTRDELSYFRKAYRDILLESSLPVFHYDFTKHTFNDVKEWVLNHQNNYQRNPEEFMQYRNDILTLYNNNLEQFKHASFDLFMNMYISARSIV
jgi:thymidylate kinase